MLSGRVAVGDQVVVSPSGIAARVRAIHAQNRAAEFGQAGDRCALNLAGEAISKDAIARGDVVLDPFFGTGTTGAVAKRLGRHFVGVEREQDYIDAATARIDAIDPAQPSSLEMATGKRGEPRIPFGVLIETGLIAPGSRIGPATAAERQARLGASMLAGKYDQALDRESAYEILLRRAQSGEAAPAGTRGAAADGTGRAEAPAGEGNGIAGVLGDFLFGSTGPRGGRRDGVVQSVAKSMVRNAANQLVRGLLGSLVGGRRR